MKGFLDRERKTMITKERLKELIQQRATVYANGVGEIELIPENDIEIYENGNDSYILYAFEPNRKYKNEIFAEELFETKEDAEFSEEFQNITRTETLSLPTFEEFKKFERFEFKAKDGHQYTIHYISGFKTLAITGIIENKYYGEATKENYIEACKIAKKLFLGEK